MAPFKPRLPMIISKALLRSLCRLEIFPNYIRLPTTHAACACLRLSRKHVTERKRQTELIKGIGKAIADSFATVIFPSSRPSSPAQHMHPATVQRDDLDNLSRPSSTLSETRTTFLLSSFTLSQSCSFIPSSQTFLLLNSTPFHVQKFPPAVQ